MVRARAASVNARIVRISHAAGRIRASVGAYLYIYFNSL
jgi:hypothetical protein